MEVFNDKESSDSVDQLVFVCWMELDRVCILAIVPN